MRRPPRIVIASLLALAASVGASVGGCGSDPVEPPPPPFFGYFDVLRPEGVYVFARIDDQATFLRRGLDAGQRFKLYVDRTNTRVFINTPKMDVIAPRSIELAIPSLPPAGAVDEDGDIDVGDGEKDVPEVPPPPEFELAERIARAYEIRAKTVLTPAADVDPQAVEPVRTGLRPPEDEGGDDEEADGEAEGR